MGGVQGVWLTFPHIAERVARKACDLCNMSTLCNCDTNVSSNVEMWEIIFNLFSIFSVVEKKGLPKHFCKSCCVKAKQQPISILAYDRAGSR